MKQILNNLWSQRGQNVWLFAELVVVCFVAWTQTERVALRRTGGGVLCGLDTD